MESTRFALVGIDGAVSNIVLWDGQTPYRPEGVEVIPCPDTVGIGWRREGTDWLPPEPSQPDQ